MRVKRVAVSVRLGLMVVWAGGLVGGWAVPGPFFRAEASPVPERREPTPAAERPEAVGVSEAADRTVPASEQASASVPSAEVLPLSELEQPATTVTEWVAQIEASLVQITGVRVEATEAGLQVVLETEEGSLAMPETRAIGNALITDIPNATIAEEFSQAEPIEGIALVSVTSLPGDRVRVAITGTDAPPVAEVTSEAQGLAFAVRLGDADATAEEDALQVVVTGEQDEGYNPSGTSTVTGTDTLLRDIPQSIQIIPQEVLRDQRADVPRALLNVPSVRVGSPSNFDAVRVQVRGFFTSPTLDGFVSREFNGVASNIGPDLTGIERIEVLQGPNSILFGSSSPGGTINFVSKQPLSDPYYFVEAALGSFSFYRGEIDLSGPLDENERILYRLNASYRNQEFFTDSSSSSNLVIAPVFSFTLGDNTNLIIEGIYKNLLQNNITNGLPATGTILPNPIGEVPLNRNFTENESGVTQFRLGYRLEHRFSENWSLSNAFRYGLLEFDSSGLFGSGLESDNRTLPATFFDGADQYVSYRMRTNVAGSFSTGSIEHQLLIGFDLGRLDSSFTFEEREADSIDLFNPVFDQSPGALLSGGDNTTRIDELGIFVQNLMTISDNFRLLLGGRFDTFTQTDEDFLANTETSQSGDAFSPRVGIVYQPTSSISLFANYARSFEPAIGRAFNGSAFRPTRGTQFEIGTRADLNNRLSTTLALYDITRSNVLTADPDNRGFSVQTGEQRSQGVELSLAGELLPGWNIFASYAYNDARISEDNDATLVGNRVQRTAPHAASLWTTYEIQRGDLQGLGLGLGLFYVGDRAGDNGNTFELPSYLTTDAAIFYRRNQFRAAINFKNLFNVDYFEGAFSRNRVFPGAPFTVEATISWTF
jgi:iron complex outermembrane receptor protein